MGENQETKQNVTPDNSTEAKPQAKPSTSSTTCGCIVLIAIVIGIFIGIGSCSKKGDKLVDIKAPKEEQFEQAEELKSMAFIMAQSLIKNYLKSPSSAQFQSYDSKYVIWYEGNRFLVTLNVDSQNSFGAMIRNYLIALVEYKGKDVWSLIDYGDNGSMAKKYLSISVSK